MIVYESESINNINIESTRLTFLTSSVVKNNWVGLESHPFVTFVAGG